MRRLLVLALVPVLLLGFTACGSDDGDALSAGDYKSQANDVCKQGNKDIEKLTKDLDESSTPEEVGKAVSKGLDMLSAQLDDIRDLNGPDKLEGDVHDLLDDAQDAIDDTKAKLDKDPEGTLNGSDPFAAVSKRFTKLGLDVCGAG